MTQGCITISCLLTLVVLVLIFFISLIFFYQVASELKILQNEIKILIDIQEKDKSNFK